MDQRPCNFRPILPNLCPGQQPTIYRSNTLDDGTTKSARWLKETVGIKTYIDLREEREFHERSKLNQYFVLKNPSKIKSKPSSIETSLNGSRFHIRFITFGYYLNVMAFRLSWSQIFYIFVLLIKHLFYKDYEYQKYGGSCYINPIGIGRFYCLLLKDCSHTFKMIFSLMTQKENFPMLISCTMGKDRTGIVSALLMGILGYSDEDIIKEYSISEILLEEMKKEIHKFFEQRGVKEEFEGSPPEAMECLLKFIHEKYGGAEGYLTHCGMSQEDIDNIRRNIQHRATEIE